MVAEAECCGECGKDEGGRIDKGKKESYSVKRKRVISQIVSEAIRLYERGEAINVQKLKSNAAREHALPDHPKLTEIIAAVPESHADNLLPPTWCTERRWLVCRAPSSESFTCMAA
eukprot:Plantae.Rhodophyta-Purpureofilum_apyrenoidigerum.ctg15181.p1 GENE.Plantae.Rhodophyta-Purpureofilum_apyrenoidigerum.ctg15181~~Plantae.Rhodophyta-Purpureofilum_apyrenoidigerum.ctg15181.p1  ORF type:complete len:116 (+),score=17.46 Plantae.Rhodophyta-Purpureofilum_apyrenoidigerum.ctg15181:80-427(+)